MLYLFSSNQAKRYLRNAMSCLAYPRDHVLRVRYDEKHVDPTIRNLARTDGVVKLPRSMSNRACMIYAECEQDRTRPFRYFPLRSCIVVRLQRVASIFYLDVSLEGYVAYGPDDGVDQERAHYQQALERLPKFPLPQPVNNVGRTWSLDNAQPQQIAAVPAGTETTQGYYLHHADGDMVAAIVTDQPTHDDAWRSVVEALSFSAALQDGLFYRIAGVFAPARHGEGPEHKRRASQSGIDTVYNLPAGQHSILELRSYRSRRVNDPGERLLDIKTGGEGFSGIAPDQVSIDSRYNSERIVLACKRVLDRTISPLRVEVRRPNGAVFEAPDMFLITRVQTARWILPAVFGLFFLGSLLLSVKPELIERLTNEGDFLRKWSAEAAAFAMVLGGLCAGGGAFIAMRSLPLKG